MPTDPGPYLHCKLTDTSEIQRYIEEHYPGLDIAPRTIETALRNRRLGFYRPGQKMHTTPTLIDKWIQSCMSVNESEITAAVSK